MGCRAWSSRGPAGVGSKACRWDGKRTVFLLAATVLALLATPYLGVNVPQIVGEIPTIALAVLALSSYTTLPRYGSLVAGCLIALAASTKLVVAPMAVFLGVGLALRDRHALPPYVVGLAAVWIAWSSVQAWEIQSSLVDTFLAQGAQVAGGAGAGLKGGEFRFSLTRFQALEYATWPAILKVHLWLYGLLTLTVAIPIVRHWRAVSPRVGVASLTLALFVLAESVWFTWVNETMWIRQAIVGWVMLGPAVVLAYWLSGSRVWKTALMAGLAGHLLLGSIWIAYPRHGAALLAADPSAWWAGAGTNCPWNELCFGAR